MFIIQDHLGFPGASFSNKEEATALFKQLDSKEWKLVENNFTFPYYYYWTWDKNDSKDKSKWKIIYGDASTIDDFIKTIHRDNQWEIDSDDDQYFYLGIIRGYGLSYGIRKALNLSLDDCGFDIFDHDHLYGDLLSHYKSVGTRIATMLPADYVAYKRLKRIRGKIKRLEKLSLSPKGEKALKRFRKKAERYGKALDPR